MISFYWSAGKLVVSAGVGEGAKDLFVDKPKSALLTFRDIFVEPLKNPWKKISLSDMFNLPFQLLDPETRGLKPCTSSPSPRWAHHRVHTSLWGRCGGCYAPNPRAKETAEILLCLCKKTENWARFQQVIKNLMFCFQFICGVYLVVLLSSSESGVNCK